jgi:hypothetical protein
LRAKEIDPITVREASRRSVTSAACRISSIAESGRDRPNT